MGTFILESFISTEEMDMSCKDISIYNDLEEVRKSFINNLHDLHYIFDNSITFKKFISLYKDNISINVISILDVNTNKNKCIDLAKKYNMNFYNDKFPDTLSIEDRRKIYLESLWYRSYRFVLDSMYNIYLESIEDTFTNGSNICRPQDSYLINRKFIYNKCDLVKFDGRKATIIQQPDSPYSSFYWNSNYLIELDNGETIDVSENDIEGFYL